MNYEYDLFLSYRRTPPVSNWVINHFYPQLKQWLDSSLPHEPRIYLDQTQETGVHWPSNLQRALLHSKCLVTVWAPQYFRSDWCMAEWQSMCEREKALNLCTPENPKGLVYPVVFHDGEHFHPSAKNIQAVSLKKWNCPDPVFKESTLYIDFVIAMQKVATEISEMILSSPPWQSGWPIVLPEPEPQSASYFPRM